MTATVRKRRGAGLFRIWAVASMAYVVAAGAVSVAPIRAAVAQASQPAAPAPALPVESRGPLPDAPDTPTVKLAKTVAKHAAITLAPPFLTLWFGWDLWFAVVGFLSPERKVEDE